MKFLVVGDLHGIKPKIKVKNFDYIIVPGDVCSDKFERPLWQKYFRYTKQCEDNSGDPMEFEDFVSKILKIKPSKLRENELKSLIKGREILEYLNSFGKPVFFVPGNWDKSFGKSTKDDNIVKHFKNLHKMFSGKTNKYLLIGLKNIYDCHLQIHTFPNFNIIGYGLSMAPELPFLKNISPKDKTKILASYNQLFDKIKTPYLKRDKSKPLIFLSHNVPYKTKLDKIKSHLHLYGEHYGSKITKDFIKKYKPLICIGAHIHEGFGKDRIGNTICINSGFGSDVNVTFEIKNNKLINLKFLGRTKL